VSASTRSRTAVYLRRRLGANDSMQGVR
jgi:hypothetical protein